MNAADVMTTRVISVAPEASVAEVARLLLDNRISAVPVIDGTGRLVGIVSEGDLVRRVESGTERHRSWWLRALSDASSLAAEYVKARGLHARDVMTVTVATISPEASLPSIATVLETRGIKRVPVVRDGKVVGIVSRANLLQALAAKADALPAASVTDSDIRDRLLDELSHHPWWADSIYTNVIVTDGVVHAWGLVQTEAERRALRVAAERIAGVRGVEDHRVPRPTVLI
jgi:CBS domain-containing protein